MSIHQNINLFGGIELEAVDLPLGSFGVIEAADLSCKWLKPALAKEPIRSKFVGMAQGHFMRDGVALVSAVFPGAQETEYVRLSSVKLRID